MYHILSPYSVHQTDPMSGFIHPGNNTVLFRFIYLYVRKIVYPSVRMDKSKSIVYLECWCLCYNWHYEIGRVYGL
jgi:hypothetical protein